jgi:bifunctional non-homologous end joining protein LigD
VTDDRRDALEQLASPDRQLTLEVGPHRLPFSNLDKVLWPRAGRSAALTKRDLLRYFARVSPWLLPHLAGRPLFITRFPQGVTGKSFYQKHWDKVPPFVRTVTIFSPHGEGDGDYLICENLPTLLWLAQLAALELHPWFSRVDPEPDALGLGRRFHGSEAALERSVLNYPDFVVFDLDPYLYSGNEARGEEPELHRRAFNRTRRLALELREMLRDLGLTTYVKTSGRTGLHLYLPIVRDLDYGSAREVAEIIGRHVLARHPREVTVEWSVERRRGKIFFDYNQNVRGKSLAAAFSPRRHARGTVSTPRAWVELESVYPPEVTLPTVPDRLEARGDPWSGMLESKQDLARLLGAEAGT